MRPLESWALVEKHPSMILGGAGIHDWLRNIGPFFRGYDLAMTNHCASPALRFAEAFSRYLHERFGWAAPADPFDAIVAHSTNEAAAWSAIWSRLRALLDTRTAPDAASANTRRPDRTLFDSLAEVHAEPNTHLRAIDTPQRLSELELVISGYEMALADMGVDEARPGFLTSFMEYLRHRFGWSGSSGPIHALISHAAHEDDAWTRFFELLADYRGAYGRQT